MIAINVSVAIWQLAIRQFFHLEKCLMQLCGQQRSFLSISVGDYCHIRLGVDKCIVRSAGIALVQLKAFFGAKSTVYIYSNTVTK